jgi:predicted O-methyltransferase YrrM
MFETGIALDDKGAQIPMHSNLPQRYAEALYRTVLRARPAVVVEVGMAFGISSLAILTALEEAGHGRLLSIDPYQGTDWHGCGLAAIERSGLGARHELVERPDYLALPKLVEQGLEIEFAYIDGWHTFDYALIDFWYADKLLAEGGIVGFNDCGFRAVAKTIAFALSHRKYVEVNVGLAPEPRTGFPAGLHAEEDSRSLRSRLEGRLRRKTLLGQDRYFRKEARWEPNWDYFRDF